MSNICFVHVLVRACGRPLPLGTVMPQEAVTKQLDTKRRGEGEKKRGNNGC